MQRCTRPKWFVIGTVLLLGCRHATVEKNGSPAKPRTPTAESGTPDELTNVNLPMPGNDGGPVLPELPAFGENEQPQLPSLPDLPGQNDGPELPGLPDLPPVPDLENKLPALPELPQVPEGLPGSKHPVSQAPSQEGSS